MPSLLGIMGSPRKNGNTHMMLSGILESAGNRGAETDLIILCDKTIYECDGCLICWKNRPCPKNDDMNVIYTMIEKADVLVFGTPVYWYGPTALMKLFIDRLVYFNCPENRPAVRGKKGIIVIPYEEESPETVEPLEKMFEMSLNYMEMRLVHKLIVPGAGEKGAVREMPGIMKKCELLGETIAGTGGA